MEFGGVTEPLLETLSPCSSGIIKRSTSSNDNADDDGACYTDVFRMALARARHAHRRKHLRTAAYRRCDRCQGRVPVFYVAQRMARRLRLLQPDAQYFTHGKCTCGEQIVRVHHGTFRCLSPHHHHRHHHSATAAGGGGGLAPLVTVDWDPFMNVMRTRCDVCQTTVLDGLTCADAQCSSPMVSVVSPTTGQAMLVCRRFPPREFRERILGGGATTLLLQTPLALAETVHPVIRTVLVTDEGRWKPTDTYDVFYSDDPDHLFVSLPDSAAVAAAADIPALKCAACGSLDLSESVALADNNNALRLYQCSECNYIFRRLCV